jgi:hypothetical protein
MPWPGTWAHQNSKRKHAFQITFSEEVNAADHESGTRSQFCDFTFRGGQPKQNTMAGRMIPPKAKTQRCAPNHFSEEANDADHESGTR